MADDTVKDLSAQPWPDDETVEVAPVPPQRTTPDAAVLRAAPAVRRAVPAAAAGAALLASVLLARRLRR
jgi:hypothetical protein